MAHDANKSILIFNRLIVLIRGIALSSLRGKVGGKKGRDIDDYNGASDPRSTRRPRGGRQTPDIPSLGGNFHCSSRRVRVLED